ncbi:hypothetical protein K466DRAFT_592531 [Polyporus arcularius HHB13444]|uniref:Uncharacterized protein n=1 Tax=Polyporus arcularius HHB13444 TaxID=1314778 RepID=A0A5C3NQZ4_9APHY|nr:hypothetical protein K466DRAFT_592531 [Polyporus arcularius HHB13444]
MELQSRSGSAVQSTGLGLGSWGVGAFPDSPTAILPGPGGRCDRRCCYPGARLADAVVLRGKQG